MASPGLEFATYCAELLSSAGQPRLKGMFGGHGIYVDELFVAIVSSERLYLKTDAQTRSRFEAAGCVPFTYAGKGRTIEVGYFSPPEEAMESPALMQPWASLALAAALRARAATRAPARSRQRKA